MSLLDELKQQKAEIAERLERAVNDVQYFDGRMADLLLAISALEPTPADVFAAEKETAREQLEREPEMPEDGLGSSLIAMGYGDDDAPVEHISILTGDPAIEPESGLHGEAVELTATKLFNEHWDMTPGGYGIKSLPQQPDSVQEAWREKARELLAAPTPAMMEMANEIIEEAPALNEAMQDEREQPVEWNEPVTSEAKMFSHGIQSEQKPASDFNPWRGLFSGKKLAGAE